MPDAPDTIAAFPDAADALGRLPALAVGPRGAVVLGADGAVTPVSLEDARDRLAATPHLLCNAPLVARRVGLNVFKAFDVLELFAFTRPARFCLPTAGGVATALELAAPGADLARRAATLRAAAAALLADLAAEDYAFRAGAGEVAMAMARGGWPWGPLVLGALGAMRKADRNGLAVWAALPEWEDGPPTPPPGDAPVSQAQARARLAAMAGEGAEPRPAQADYAAAVAGVFAPRAHADAPNLTLAEAGTGTGKTLGYLAPASLWAEDNGGAVWLSTYTRNLQRQIDQELDRLYPDPRVKAARAVIRKGRENYACLLNIEETTRAVAARAGGERDKVLMGLVLRWARFSRDGDMIGGDFPSWLGAHFGPARVAGLTDHRGECLYSACAHYRRCFIERATRRAKRADLVIANHALVMTQAVRRAGDPDLPRRLVFDEGHHVFDAADSAFSAHLSGLEGAELRRWLRGRELSARGHSRGGRGRGLRARIEELIAGDDPAEEQLAAVLEAARLLPGDGWQTRLRQAGPDGAFEAFLAQVRAHVHARAAGRDGGHSLEASLTEPAPALGEAATALSQGLDALARPMTALAGRLKVLLDDRADDLDSGSRGRLDAAARALSVRAEAVGAWRSMLAAVGGATPADHVDWFDIARIDGRELDVGLARHWLDPTVPFAAAVLEPAHGVAVTSATLRDRTGDPDADTGWQSAELRTGAQHLVMPARRFAAASPFDYAATTRVFVVTDVDKASVEPVAGAYRALFAAAGGGALGLFTAIRRLKAVYARLAPALDAEGLALYAQHVDPIDVGTLVDIFRAERDACLLGTDAVRDGVDVPGSALRLMVLDRVPWPRPTILHKARKAAFGPRGYDDLITRLRLQQAFGRLIRRAGDRGVFAILDPQTPSRLLTAFPDGVTARRVGLAEAVAETRAFLSDGG